MDTQSVPPGWHWVTSCNAPRTDSVLHRHPSRTVSAQGVIPAWRFCRGFQEKVGLDKKDFPGQKVRGQHEMPAQGVRGTENSGDEAGTTGRGQITVRLECQSQGAGFVPAAVSEDEHNLACVLETGSVPAGRHWSVRKVATAEKSRESHSKPLL